MSRDLNIAEIIKSQRSSRSLTQQAVADMINVSRSRYGSYEEGRATPSITLLMDLARLYGYKTLDSFLNLKMSHKNSKDESIERRYMSLPADKKAIVDFIMNNKPKTDKS